MEWAKNIYNKLPSDTRLNLLNISIEENTYGQWGRYTPGIYNKNVGRIEWGMPGTLGILNDRTYRNTINDYTKNNNITSSISASPSEPGKIDYSKKPGTWGKPETSNINWGGVVSSITSGLPHTINSFTTDMTVDNLLRDTGKSTAYRNGIAYGVYNNIDTKPTDKTGDILGNTMAGINTGTAISPGWGTLIGGIAGLGTGIVAALVKTGKEKKKIEEALNLVNRYNLNYGNIAASEGMQRDWYDKHMNTYDLVLYGAYGLDRGRGIKAMVTPGEIKVDRNGNGKLEQGGIPGIDSIKENLSPFDAILSKRLGYAQEALPTLLYQEHLRGLANRNKGKNRDIAYNTIKAEYKKTQDFLLAKAEELKADRINGDIPVGDNMHAAVGWDSLAVNGGAAIMGLVNYINHRGLKIKNPYTYVGNPYGASALNTLNSLSPISPSQIIKNNLEAEHRAIHNINKSGGLSSSLRMAGYTQIASNSLNNLFKMLSDVLQYRNSLKAQAANAALNLGNNIGVEKTKANQFDLDYYSKAHAAWLNQQNTDLATIYGAARQYVTDKNNYDLYKKMLSYYEEEAKSKRKGIG